MFGKYGAIKNAVGKQHSIGALAQLIEDALCLVFVEDQLAEFSPRVEAAKLKEIVEKTLEKMSPEGRSLVNELLSR